MLIVEFLIITIIWGPKIFSLDPYVVTSGSMEPKYPVGSIIYVKKNVAPEQIHVGDAITFYMKDSKIVATHEVYKMDIANKLFFTQGINNFDSDGNIIHDTDPVLFSNLIGTPVFAIPFLGFVQNIIVSKTGSFCLIIITIFLIIISYLIEKKKGKEYEEE